jgi:hypothetical protein
MSQLDEQLSDQFRRWELRGRGWRVYDEPVAIEPPFVPFHGHYLPVTPRLDDTAKPTFFSSLVQQLSQKLAPSPTLVEPEPEEEPEPRSLVREEMIELQTSLPSDLNIAKDAFEQFLLNLSLCREPVAFELLGSANRVTVQFAAHPQDAPLVRRQLSAYFPDATFQPRESTLADTWATGSGEDELVVEFGLAHEFMLPLATGKLDPFVGIVGALAELQAGELALFQVLFQLVQEDWPESIVRSVTHANGKPFFVDAPELAKAAEHKVAKPLYAAVVRIAINTGSQERTLQLARDLAGSLRVFAHPQGNELIPLTNDDYPFADHIEDVIRRQSRRSGMILNSDELIGFVHLPSGAVRSPALQRETGKTKAAPAIVRNHGILLGTNVHAGKTVDVRLSPEQRTRHCHVIGASGTGKSTLLFNLIRQDIDRGEGVAVFDPHGDLVDKILGSIPPERLGDMVLVDPSDDQSSIGFNILSAHSDLEKNLLASDLVAVFQRLSTSWGDQMNSVLQNAILAFLESTRRGTLADLRCFLIEPAFRNEFLKSVHDEEVVYYWQKGFPHLTGNKSIGPILTRLETFLSPKPIRYMVSQPENRLDFAHIMDTGKIFLAKLPEGLLGKENSYLLGTLLMSKFQQMAMSRQAQQMATRRDYWIYADEFHNYISPSMAEILSGARKYRIGLTLAHHELHQLQRNPEVASAVMSHPFTRIVFRVGDDDAKKLGEGFACFEARDLKNLETGQAIVRVERSDFDFNLSVPMPDKLDEATATARRHEVITRSREKYGTPRAEVQAMLAKSRARVPTVEPPASPPARPVVEPSKAAEVPKTTEPLPVVATVASPTPAVAEIPKPKAKPPVSKHEPPRDLGRGGAQHQAIQKRIKEAAETLGFRSIIEKPVLDGQGSVDLWLERTGQSIACEISISTTIDHEFKNVAKCLRAGVPKVAVICLDEERLRKINNAVSGSLETDAAARVMYFQPDQFVAHLKTIPSEIQKEKTTVRHGYKIKRVVSEISTEQQKEKEASAIRAIADSMRK